MESDSTKKFSSVRTRTYWLFFLLPSENCLFIYVYIGHVNLMLSGLMIGVKNQNELEMKGTYQLCKLLPSQRVSGSIKIHTYLHVPDIIFLSDIFRSISSSNAISELAARKADDNDLETSVRQ